MAIEIGGYHTLGQVNLSNIATAISNEPAMVHVSADTLEHSYTADHRAVVAQIKETKLPIGFARFSYLFGPKEISKLQITGLTIPTVYELGSVYISPDFRNQGLSVELIKTLLQMHKSQLKNNDELLIGTTKNPRIIRCLDDFDFSFIHHLDLPYVTALTCTCSQPMGTGFQYDNNHNFYCSARIKNDLITQSEWINRLGKQCVMFTSSLSLAEQTNNDLERFFTTPQQFTQELIKSSYYNNTYAD